MSNASETGAIPSDFRIPVVRHFIACEGYRRDPGRENYSLINVIHRLTPLPGEGYPRIHPAITLFVQMSDGRGNHSFQVQKVFLDDESTSSTGSVTLDFGNDPLIVHSRPFVLKRVFFPVPGYYEFRLLCNGHVIARETILVRENP